MKKTKILVPALGILCLSMAAAVTGTVAWFSTNATVDVAGMKIKATTATNLFIYNDVYSSATGMFTGNPSGDTIIGAKQKSIEHVANTGETGGLTLTPASTNYEGEFKEWYYVANSSNIEMGGGYFSNGTVPADTMSVATISGGVVGEAKVKKYVEVGHFYLYLQDSDDRNVTVNLTITPSNVDAADMLPVARCALLFSDADVDGTFAEKEASSGLNRAIFSSDGDAITKPMATISTLMSEAQATKTAGAGPVSLGAIKANHVIGVSVYFWFEGQDAECINQNSLNSEDYSVSMLFNATVVE